MDKLSPRERYLKICSFERNNDVFPVKLNCWNNTYKRWINEGMPCNFENAFVETNDYFVGNLNQNECLGISGTPLGLGKNNNPPWVSPVEPPFEQKIIEESETHVVMVDYDGAIVKRSKEDFESMPQWLKYPVADKKSWDEYKKRLNPKTPSRFFKDWDKMTKENLSFSINKNLKGRSFEERNFPLGINCGSLIGLPRDYMGLENFSLAMFDNLKLVIEMIEWQIYFAIDLLKIIYKAGITLDWIFIWEDIAYNKGSLFSTEFIKKYVVPGYKRLVDFINSNGTHYIFVDCDGNVDELLPIFVDCGINGIYPLEVAAGMDGLKVRKKFGKNLIIYGNIDKRALAKGKSAIDQEIEKVKELLKIGGYFPCVDHWIPPDVSFENISYYFEELYKLNKY